MFESEGTDALEAFEDYDLALLAIKLVEDGYTANKWLASVVADISPRIDRLKDRTKLRAHERRAAETVIPEIVGRWKKMNGLCA